MLDLPFAPIYYIRHTFDACVLLHLARLHQLLKQWFTLTEGHCRSVYNTKHRRHVQLQGIEHRWENLTRLLIQKNLTNVQRNIWTIENPTNIPLLITSFFNYVDTANIIVVVECCIMGCRHIYLKHYDINKIALCHLKYVHKGRNVNNILKNKNMIVRKNLISNLIHQPLCGQWWHPEAVIASPCPSMIIRKVPSSLNWTAARSTLMYGRTASIRPHFNMTGLLMADNRQSWQW